MKILVAVKRVVDYKASIRVKADGSGVDTQNVKMSMNPFDEIAVEEAVRLKEKNIANEILAVSIGTDLSQEILRTALAMGADRAVLVKTDVEVQPLDAARILQNLIAKENPNLVILGKQAIDTDNNQVGQMLAGLMKWSQGTFASEVIVDGDTIKVTREIDGGLETLKLKLPAVVTTDLRLNEPRYLSLPNIVKAKTKKIDVMTPDEMGVTVKPRIRTLKVTSPAKNRQVKRVESAAELVRELKEKQVI